MGTELQPGSELKQTTNSKIVQMVQAISQVGPDIPEIARRINAYKETVRYWYKEKLVRKGFAVSSMVNHSKLGLRRVMLLIDLSDMFESYGPALFTAMNELCYVVGFEKTLPEGRYIVQASVPGEFVDSFGDLMIRLREMGLFKTVEIFHFEYTRNTPMRAEFFDFSTGEWEFDWSSPPGLKGEVLPPADSAREKFDVTDLYLLKELQIDPDRSMIDVSEALRSKHNLENNYKTLVWHLTNHVQKLIPGYRVNWMGTRYDIRTEKAMHRQHTYLRVDILVRNVKDAERMRLIGEINRLPFLWWEAVGACYYAQLAFPTEMVTEAFEFLRNALAPVRGDAQYYVMDQRTALNFTFSYQLYDGDQKAWKFEKEPLLTRFANLVVQVKGGSG